MRWMSGKQMPIEQQKPGLFFDWPGNEATITNDDFDFKVANPYNPEILAIL